MTARTDGGTLRGAILAGGGSTRFGGRPKGLEKVGGERIVDRVIHTVRQLLDHPPQLVTSIAEAQRWTDLVVVPDTRPDMGSLGGLYSAVTAGDGPVLVVAWDMPFVTVELLHALAKGAGWYDAFLPESGGPRTVEPLCGIYTSACAAAIERRLDAEDLRATAFHDEINLGVLPREQVAEFGDPHELFFNVNTPGDLERANQIASARR